MRRSVTSIWRASAACCIEVDPDELAADVVYQIGALQLLARTAGSSLSHVKPHGALYNTIAVDRDQARAVAEAVYAVDPGLPVLGQAGSVFFAEARRLTRRWPKRSPTVLICPTGGWHHGAAGAVLSTIQPRSPTGWP